jgi:hypothetical protein
MRSYLVCLRAYGYVYLVCEDIGAQEFVFVSHSCREYSTYLHIK